MFAYWQLDQLPHRGIIIDEVVDAFNQPKDSDLWVRFDDIICLLLKKCLEKMGFKQTGTNLYSHFRLTSPICIKTKSWVSSNKCATTYGFIDQKRIENIITEDAYKALSPEKLQKILPNWLNALCRSFLKDLIPRADMGFMLIIGTAFDNPTMQTLFEQDKILINHMMHPSSQMNNVSPWNGTSLSDGVELFRALRENQLVELLIVNDCVKEVVIANYKTFIQSTYRSSLVMYSGHGSPDGEMVFRIDDNHEDENFFTTITPSEWADARETAMREINLAGLGDANTIYNTCYSHIGVGGQANQDRSGMRTFAVTDAKNPTAPGGGMLELALNDPSKFEYFPFYRDFLKNLPKVAKMNLLLSEIERRGDLNVFDRRPDILPLDKDIPRSGIYMFPPHVGDSYLIWDKIAKHAILFDSGKMEKVWVETVWNKFLVKFAQTYTIIISHVDADHIKGFAALSRKNELFSLGSYPKCKGLVLNAPDNTKVDSTNRADYITGTDIVNSLERLGVEITRKAIAGDVLYDKNNILVKVLSPSESSKDLQLYRKNWEIKLSRASTDDSVANKASIVLLVSYESSCFGLLCADSVEELVIEALEQNFRPELAAVAPATSSSASSSSSVTASTVSAAAVTTTADTELAFASYAEVSKPSSVSVATTAATSSTSSPSTSTPGIPRFKIATLPHHGSKANCSAKFFKDIVAEKYLISANGKTHSHPSVLLPKDKTYWTLYQYDRNHSDGTSVIFEGAKYDINNKSIVWGETPWLSFPFTS